MRRIRAWLVRIAGIFNKSQRDQELSAELESHLQLHIDDNLRAGMTPAEARRRAIIKLGGIESTKESYRERRSIPVIETLLQDVRFGLRMLRRNTGFTAVVVLTLALGIGANSAIFSLINVVLLRPLPVPHSAQLLLLKWTSDQKPTWKSYHVSGGCEEDFHSSSSAGCAFSFSAFDKIRAHATSVSSIAAISEGNHLQVSFGSGTEHSEVKADYVSGDFFGTVQTPAFLGRTLLPTDDRLNTESAAVISYNFWQRRFGGDATVVGRSIFIEDAAFTVVGVAPKGFPGVNQIRPSDVWIPIHSIAQLKRKTMWTTPDSPTPWLAIIARLKPDSSRESAQAELDLLYRAAMADDPQHSFPADATTGILLTDFSHGTFSFFRQRFSQPLVILMVIVSCVLLIACANIASLNLARASGRRGEIAVRFALGAGRERLLQQLFTESVLLAVAGAAAGSLLAIWLTQFMAAFVGLGLSVPLLLEVKPSPLVLAYTAGVATLSALFFGLLPAISSSRVNPSVVVKASGGAVGGAMQHSSKRSRRKRPLARVLVTTQVGVALVLLVGAGLFIRTLINLEYLNTGFDKQHVLAFSASLFSNTDTQGPQAEALNDDLRAKLSALPGVISVSWSNGVLLDGSYGSSTISVKQNGHLEDRSVRWMSVGPEIFKTLGIPIIAGRDVERGDLHQNSAIVWINHNLAQRFFTGENPVGKQLRMGSLCIVAGVVGDTKYESIRGEMLPTVYTTYNSDIPAYNFMIRTAGDPGALATDVRQIVHQTAPEATIYSVKTESQMLDQQLFYERLLARLSLIFGLMALLLTCVGVYGVLAYATLRRTGEIAIRISLGAMPQDILRLIISDGLRPAIAGAIIGLLGCFALTSLLTKFLYGIKPFDPATFCAATLLMLVVAAIACYIPARRATRVDPMVALRHE